MIKKVAFTGHRPQSFGGENSKMSLFVKEQLKLKIDQAIKEGYNYFISGGALGVDQWALEILIEIKKTQEIYIEIAKPFPSQEKVWSEDQKNHFQSLQLKVDKVYNVSEDPYSVDKMNKRNRYMVDNCDLLIAVWNGQKSGTGNTVNYSKIKSKPIWVIGV